MAVVGTDLLIVERSGVVHKTTALDVSGLAGVPNGGTSGQLLTKASGTDYDTSWGVKITLSTSAPGSPSVGDIWVDTTP